MIEKWWHKFGFWLTWHGSLSYARGFCVWRKRIMHTRFLIEYVIREHNGMPTGWGIFLAGLGPKRKTLFIKVF